MTPIFLGESNFRTYAFIEVRFIFGNPLTDQSFSNILNAMRPSPNLVLSLLALISYPPKVNWAFGKLSSNFVSFNGIVNRAKPCKCDICLVSRILLHQRITSSLEDWRFLIFDSHWQLSAIISSHKFIQGHFSEGCLFLS